MNSLATRTLASAALVLATLALVACGGGGSTSGNSGGGGTTGPSLTGSYSVASLNGNYAFSMSGTDNTQGLSIARIGSFHADGAGNITAAIEDVNDGGSVSTFNFSAAPASTYTIDSDGKGVLTLAHPDAANPSVNDQFTFTIALTSTSGGLLVETDGSSTMSGNFRLQNITSTFATSYAFDFSGLDLGNQTNASFVGQFNTNGSTGITGGLMDLNDGATPSGALTLSPGTISLDATNFSDFGRGTMTLTTTISSQVLNLNYIFYVIDGSNIIFVENDTVAETTGSAIAQTAPPTAPFAGSFVFALGGGAFNGSSSFGPLTRAGRFTSDASGNLTNVSLDQDFTGGTTVVPKSGGFSNVSVTVDPAGSGRGMLNFTDVTSGTPYVFIFYMASPTQGFIQDNSAGVIADGTISAQSGTFNSASMAGQYAINWSGQNLDNGFEEDFVGVIPVSSSGTNNITGGLLDYTELGDGKIFTNVGVNGLLNLQGDGTLGGAQGNALQLTSTNSPSATYNFRAYIIDTNTIVLVGVDNDRVVIGNMIRQQ